MVLKKNRVSTMRYIFHPISPTDAAYRHKVLRDQFSLQDILEHLRSKKAFMRGDVVTASKTYHTFQNLNQLETILQELKWEDDKIQKVWLYGTGWFMRTG